MINHTCLWAYASGGPAAGAFDFVARTVRQWYNHGGHLDRSAVFKRMDYILAMNFKESSVVLRLC